MIPAVDLPGQKADPFLVFEEIPHCFHSGCTSFYYLVHNTCPAFNKNIIRNDKRQKQNNDNNESSSEEMKQALEPEPGVTQMLTISKRELN